jgi:FixJ family two-component response regulator
VPAFRPDVVLLNVGLPGISGELVLDCLHVSDSDVPIIIMTGDRDPGLERALRARGAYDFIANPFKLDWLMPRVKAALAFRTDGAPSGIIPMPSAECQFGSGVYGAR